MDYIYNGEVQIFQENLDRFLSVAQRLKLEGLIGDPSCQQNSSVAGQADVKVEDIMSPEEAIPIVPNKKASRTNIAEKVLVPMSANYNIEVNKSLDEHMEKCSDGSLKCLICGKVISSRNKKQDLRKHIETHIEGLSFPCNQCGNTFRSRNLLNVHRSSLNHRS